VNGVTPSVRFSVTRSTGSSGEEYCALVTDVSVTASAAAAADGTALLDVVANFTPPSDPQWGGAEIVVQKPDTNYYTLGAGVLSPLEQYTAQPASSQTWKFFVRSIDINGKRNTIVGGTTPEVDLTVGSSTGQLNLAKVLSTSISTQFSVTAGALHINALDAGIITTGTLKVGNNGSGFPVQLAVYDHLGSLIGWVGDDTGGSGFVGGWMKQFRIGGSSPSSATITADSSGNVTVGVGTIGSGTLPGGVIYAGTINCSQLNAGTISAAISVTAGTFTGSTLVLNLNSITTSINNAGFHGQGNVGLSVTDGSYATGVLPGAYLVWQISPALLASILGAGYLQLFDLSSGAQTVLLNSSQFFMSGLPSSNPGGGSKKFWYDPSDSNRVKYAA
jgi:hypothetical protein